MKDIDRRHFLAGAAATGTLLASPAKLFAQNDVTAMPQIPVVDLTGDANLPYAMDLRIGSHTFGTGVATDTFGINSNYLGPLVKVRRGQDVQFDVTNSIGELTAVHWHGLHIPGDVDGGPHQSIQPVTTWSPVLTIDQPAGLNWFHAHTHGHTMPQVYKGLAGLLLIEDDDSLAADLPRTFGVDEFAVVLQDKLFDAAGKAIQTTENVNNALVVNGVVGPVRQITPKGWVRLRLLNGSNGAFIKLTTDTGQPFQVIGSDGGFLSAPAATDILMISPGERYDVLVDCSAGNPVTLNAVSLDDEDVSATDGVVTTQKTQLRQAPVLRLQPSTQISGFTGTLPKKLAALPAADPSVSVRRRKFVLNERISQRMIRASAGWGNTCHGEHKAMGINGRPMDMTFINERVPRGDYEIWEVTSDGGAHPFHIHGCSFRILKQLGVRPPEYASGWKDMMYAGDGLTSELLVQFNYDAPDATPYMYHCHILKHEDCGMMGQFTVGDKTAYSAPITL